MWIKLSPINILPDIWDNNIYLSGPHRGQKDGHYRKSNIEMFMTIYMFRKLEVFSS